MLMPSLPCVWAEQGKCAQGTYYLVSTTNAAQNQITISATYFKASIGIGDTIAGFTNVSQPLGTVCQLFC